MKKTKDKTVLENQESAKKIQELEESVKEVYAQYLPLTILCRLLTSWKNVALVY